MEDAANKCMLVPYYVCLSSLSLSLSVSLSGTMNLTHRAYENVFLHLSENQLTFI